MWRYYAQGAEKLNITQKYRSINEVDYEETEAILKEFSSVHKVPVIGKY